MNKAKCEDCKNILLDIFFGENGKRTNIIDHGYCSACDMVKPKSKFFMKFGFESYEKQDEKENLDIGDHKLVWRSIGGGFKYHCFTCDKDLLRSHHHHP